MESEADKIESRPVDAKLKIFFLPNLMTAGNLFCGFVCLQLSSELSGIDFLMVQIDQNQRRHLLRNGDSQRVQVAGKAHNHAKCFRSFSDLRDEKHIVNDGDCSSNHWGSVSSLAFALC